jgi:voltage-gated potassium channel
MVEKRDILIFGYGRFGKNIFNSLKDYDAKVRVAVATKEEYKLAKEHKDIRVDLFDLEDDSSIKKLDITEDLVVVCAMDNNHENLFLSLSIRDAYTKNYIVSISDSINVTDKLRMTGVNRVIDVYQISGNILKNILNIPVATKFLQGFINKSHDYIFKEIKIGENAIINGKKLSEIDFNRFNIIFIGMIDEEIGNQFVFNTTGYDHKVDLNDTLVCVGKEQDIFRFQLECAGVRV